MGNTNVQINTLLKWLQTEETNFNPQQQHLEFVPCWGTHLVTVIMSTRKDKQQNFLMHTPRNNQFCTQLNKTFYLKPVLTLFLIAKLLLHVTEATSKNLRNVTTKIFTKLEQLAD